MSTNDTDPDRPRRTYQVTEWLIERHDFGATAPLPAIPPVRINGHTVGFWQYYPQTSRMSEPTSKDLGQLLRSLHDLPTPNIELRQWTPLESLHQALLEHGSGSAINAEERAWLLRRVDEIRKELSELDWPLGIGLIHGDAWAGNLLWDNTTEPPRVILGDWDRVSIGPREVDLIPTWHAAVRYGRDVLWVRNFIEEYGYDLSDWPGYPVLLEMRDLVQVAGPLRRAAASPEHAVRLRERISDIRAGNRTKSWSQYVPHGR
ncbi:aminoglycoside phosphotransferase family protein [Nocardia sp. NBC_00508]|uniref:aminoglycoside phosphotransferase family protein n=1 Tax=Nocardia sp. NBC_00508 TaxID=2975992 RepID=UPI002E80C4EA|nr:aminoglycoside phosphotransferase family protein [Nocardia sp. NBC_00508]WUD67190.1 aminoglycoside phosphotransferase family protein [Nocardia sp. NBC_00508]